MPDRQLAERAPGARGSAVAVRMWPEPPRVGFRPRRWKLVSTRLSRSLLLGLGVLLSAVALTWAGAARAVTIAPPWCGTPEPDAAGALPDGTNPTDPPGNFPHIPYYAIGCTLDAIKAESLDGRMSVQVFGHSARGRPMYLVTINQLATHDQQKAFQNWEKIHADALDDPAKAQKRLAKVGGE